MSGFLRGQDAWRRHPIFQWGWKEALPGIREGTALFALYVAGEYALSKAGAGKGAAAHHAAVAHQDGLAGAPKQGGAAHH